LIKLKPKFTPSTTAVSKIKAFIKWLI
jgi:hypothetical protein